MDREDTSTSSEDEKLLATLKERSKRGWFKGISIIIIALIPLILLLIFPTLAASELLLISIFGISAIVLTIGIILLAIAGRINAYLFDIGILKILDPNPIITEEYAVTSLEDVIIFVIMTAEGSLYFAKNDKINARVSEKINVPRTFPRWGFHKLAGYKVHRREGHFAIPTPEGEIIATDTVIYRLPTFGEDYILHRPDFTRERLLELISAVSREGDAASQ
ncbi:MAG: hypothetical protein ACTSYL_12565 [Candidatus Thorarchaeota archaeon]